MMRDLGAQRPARATDGPSARAMFEVLQQLARAQGLALRAPPPEPTTCCGRGCNGCVWEGYLDAAEYWRQEALLQIDPVDFW
ncbi:MULTISPECIES: oxidoreductase-like domain-containing protein [unclassified Acidovorax]|uniref:oxidoreductase-like domain-containing protein n=2 Tax=Acidovorax TaxID=12916 RepID=UPI001E54656D|nr:MULTISPECIES: oxidoreductase-like domain-containing protein [unclassified Acidovorax]